MSNAKIEGKPKFVLARNKGFPFIFIVRSTRPKTAKTFEVGIAQVFREESEARDREEVRSTDSRLRIAGWKECWKYVMMKTIICMKRK